MPAVSQAQQRLMGACYAGAGWANCPHMTHQQFHDFAATPLKGLPYRVRAASGLGNDYTDGDIVSLGSATPLPKNQFGTDIVPAALTPKEMVLTQKQQSAVMPVPGKQHLLKPSQLRALHAQSPRMKFDDGGMANKIQEAFNTLLQAGIIRPTPRLQFKYGGIPRVRFSHGGGGNGYVWASGGDPPGRGIEPLDIPPADYSPPANIDLGYPNDYTPFSFGQNPRTGGQADPASLDEIFTGDGLPPTRLAEPRGHGGNNGVGFDPMMGFDPNFTGYGPGGYGAPSDVISNVGVGSYFDFGAPVWAGGTGPVAQQFVRRE